MADIREALLEVMQWIENWDPQFIHDDEWPETRERVRAALADGGWLIWSNEHRAWWRPNCQGYTTYLEAAGRYSHEDALDICREARHGWEHGAPPSEIPVCEADALFCAQPPESA